MKILEIGKLYYFLERNDNNMLDDWENRELYPNFIGRFISGNKSLLPEWSSDNKKRFFTLKELAYGITNTLIEREPFLVLESFFDEGIMDYCGGNVYQVIQNHDIGKISMGYFKLIECDKFNFKKIKDLVKYYNVFAADGAQI